MKNQPNKLHIIPYTDTDGKSILYRLSYLSPSLAWIQPKGIQDIDITRIYEIYPEGFRNYVDSLNTYILNAKIKSTKNFQTYDEKILQIEKSIKAFVKFLNKKASLEDMVQIVFNKFPMFSIGREPVEWIFVGSELRVGILPVQDNNSYATVTQLIHKDGKCLKKPLYFMEYLYAYKAATQIVVDHIKELSEKRVTQIDSFSIKQKQEYIKKIVEIWKKEQYTQPTPSFEEPPSQKGTEGDSVRLDSILRI